MAITHVAHRRRATISDVASAAGVSAPTVSRVINGSAAVTAPTRRRVEAAIDQLNYRPSDAARGLAFGRTMTIGAVVPFVTHPSAVQRVRGLIEGLRESPYPLSLYDVEASHHRTDHFAALTGGLPPMGVVVISLEPTVAELDAFRSSGSTVAFIEVDVPGFSRVIVDHREGGRIATRHLLDLGHERIGFVGDAEDDPLGFTSSALHRAGYEETLTGAGLAPDRELVRTGSHGRREARLLGREMLQHDRRPTAIFASSDTQGMGVIDAARDLNIDVPKDLSVIGFDDIEMSEHMGLTTVHQPLEESGRMAAEILIEAIAASEGDVVCKQLPVSLVVRGTTGRP